MCCRTALLHGTAAPRRNTVKRHLRLVIGPDPHTLLRRITDQLRVHADPRFARPELTDEFQRPAWRQRPCPPPQDHTVRTAAAAARTQDGPGWLGVTVRSPADDFAAIGELQTYLVGLPLREYAPRRARHWIFVEARDIRPDEAGHEEFETIAVGPYTGDRDRGLLGPVKLQGVDRHEGREFRLRRVPSTRHPACQLRDRWSFTKGAHGISLSPRCLTVHGPGPTGARLGLRHPSDRCVMSYGGS